MKRISARNKMTAALALLALVSLGACTQLEKDVGQCEPGVSDLSTLSNVPNANPC